MARDGGGGLSGLPRGPIAAAWALVDFSYADFQVAIAALAGLKGKSATDPALARVVNRRAVVESGGTFRLTPEGRSLAEEVGRGVDVNWAALRSCLRAAVAEATRLGPSAFPHRSRPPGLMETRAWGADPVPVDWAVREALGPSDVEALEILQSGPRTIESLAAVLGAQSTSATSGAVGRLVDLGLAFDASPGAEGRDAEWFSTCEATASVRRKRSSFLEDPGGTFSALRRRALLVEAVERARLGVPERHGIDSDAKAAAIRRSARTAKVDAMLASCAGRPQTRAVIAAAAGMTLDKGYEAKVLREIMDEARTKGLRELDGFETGPHRFYVSGPSWDEGGTSAERWLGLERVVFGRRLQAGMVSGRPYDRCLMHVSDSRAFVGEVLDAWDEGLSVEWAPVWTLGEVEVCKESWGEASCDLGCAPRPRGWSGFAQVAALLVDDDGSQGSAELAVNDLRGFDGHGDEILLSISRVDDADLLRSGTVVLIESRVAAMLGGVGLQASASGR
ncbi:hypothetical protein [Methylopila sp. M107]|uniref:hypothetical protein n=1 Tax=Methylopila sp. M107 TaxID=1101190 RepID=UPI00036267E2|nr:hypothetical protein [Methylopila sp. M107]